MENPDFTFGSDSWRVIPTGAVATDTNNNQRASTLDNSVYRHTGSITTQPCLIQRVFINGKAGDTFRFGAWAKVTDGLPLASGRSCAFRIQTDDGEGNDIETLGRIDYNTNTQNWQYMQKSFTLDQDTAFVDLYLSYDRQMGSVMYDGIQLYKEEAQAESSEQRPWHRGGALHLRGLRGGGLAPAAARARMLAPAYSASAGTKRDKGRKGQCDCFHTDGGHEKH